jgi:hypothetical protein
VPAHIGGLTINSSGSSTNSLAAAGSGKRMSVPEVGLPVSVEGPTIKIGSRGGVSSNRSSSAAGMAGGGFVSGVGVLMIGDSVRVQL